MALKSKRKDHFQRIQTDEPTDEDKSISTNEEHNVQIHTDENTNENNIVSYYKTLNHSTIQTIINKEYKYRHDFDKNGIIYAIGTDFNTQSMGKSCKNT
eukprot:26362_1